MLAITCDKCRRRYTATDEELRVYQAQAEGKKYAQVLCPHCGRANKVPADRIHQGLRFSPPGNAPAPAQVETGAASGPGGPPSPDDTTAAGTLPEEENPPA